MSKKIFASTLLLTILLALVSLAPLAVEAQQQRTGGVKELQENLGGFGNNTGLGKAEDKDLKGRMAQIINIVLGFLGIVAIIYIIRAGYGWMTAGGNEEDITKAKQTIKNAVIGLLVVLLSYIIVNFTVEQLSKASEPGGPGGGGGGGVPNVDGTAPPARPGGW